MCHQEILYKRAIYRFGKASPVTIVCVLFQLYIIYKASYVDLQMSKTVIPALASVS